MVKSQTYSRPKAIMSASEGLADKDAQIASPEADRECFPTAPSSWRLTSAGYAQAP